MSLYNFVPCIPITIILLIILLKNDKSTIKYRNTWSIAFFLTAIIGTIFWGIIVFASLHHESHRSYNYLSIKTFIAGLFAVFIALPSYPALILLGLFPPKKYSSEKQRNIRMTIPATAVLLSLVLLFIYLD